MKKVLVIAPYSYLPFFSGGQKSIALFLAYLGKETELTVISVKENDFSLAPTYKSLPLLKKSFARYYDLSLVKKITAIIKENNIETVLWEHPYFAWLAFRIRKKTGVKTIFHTHNIEYLRFKTTGKWWWPILKVYEKNCFKKADALFFISDDDMNFAVNKWHIQKDKCTCIPFGVEVSQYPEDKEAARNTILATHTIDKADRILLFNGLLNYKPNIEALEIILGQINPGLLAHEGFKYKIIICGKGLPDSFNELKEYADKNIIYAGFVKDIELYFKAADIFLSPVLTGGGVKTKMVEAIAFGTTVLSTEASAIGIDKSRCGNKLLTVKDNDWDGMVTAVVNYDPAASITPAIFYETYNWGNIVKRILPILK